MPNTAKVNEVGELRTAIQGATGLVMTDYRGLKVQELQELRRRLRPRGIEYHVVKNTLFTIAAGQEGLPEMAKLFDGPTAIALSRGDEVDLAKGIVDETRALKTVRIYGGLVRGRILSAAEIAELAALPGRAQLQAILVGALEAPLSQLVSTLAAPLRELIATFNARGAQA